MSTVKAVGGRPSSPKYIAEVRDSRELMLYGTADLEFWTRKLQPEGLLPLAREGKAELMISAVASRWLAVPFSEFMIALVTQTAESELGWPSLYLLAAFNTNRPFTFIEQRYFQTPYSHATIEVGIQSRRAGFQLTQQKQTLLRGFCGGETENHPLSPATWEGVIYLPPRNPVSRNLFYAKLAGPTAVIPFRPDVDQLKIHSSGTNPVCDWLLQSEFMAREWHVRPRAQHARSKTLPRGR